jgi:hypothetical protein
MDLGVSHDAFRVQRPCLLLAILTPVDVFGIFADTMLVAVSTGPKLIAKPST